MSRILVTGSGDGAAFLPYENSGTGRIGKRSIIATTSARLLPENICGRSEVIWQETALTRAFTEVLLLLFV